MTDGEPADARPGRVSVVIPAFGRQQQLLAAIASVLPQLEPGDEVVVVDDGSTPPLRLAAGTPPAVRLIRCERNGGAARARNTGITEARNALVAFLDSDDLWLAGKLQAQRRLLRQHPGESVAVACGWNETVDGRVVRRRVPKPSRSRSDFFAGCWFCPGSTLLIGRAAFAIDGLYDEHLKRLEDLEWFLRFAGSGGRLVVLDAVAVSIARGGNARPGLVAAAARAIETRVDATPGVSPGEIRDLRAYLDLERSAAHRNVSHRWRAGFFLVRSLLRRPRLRLHLRAWWTPGSRGNKGDPLNG